MPYLTGFEAGLMLRVCSVTTREMLDISVELHTNRSLLHRRKSMNSLPYLGFKPTSILMVLAGSSVLICTALASSAG
jgi:hypothetical protein